ncbi:MAG TPA: hypothetical protein VFP35_00870 [Candidatus Saccharimonadales bacterium]|nr:hypothetical protein [Candidatus Saccharimonadales bacterium]
MTGFNHGMTGAVIALFVKQPALAVPLALASHFVTDIIPHWDYGVSRGKGKPEHFDKQFNLVLTSDFLFSVLLMVVLALLFPSQKWLIWACMIASACPDLMWAYYQLYKSKIKGQKPKFDPLARFHLFIQWSQTKAGGLVELAWFISAWAVVLVKR